MGFRFRKSLKIIPGVRLNLSKTGVSASVGGPGATVNFGPKGTRQTVGIPGTGISYSEFTGHSSSRDDKYRMLMSEKASNSSSGNGCTALFATTVSILAAATCTFATAPDPSTNHLLTPAADAVEEATSDRSAAIGSTAFVAPAVLNGRSGPSTSHSILHRLHHGDSVRIVERHGNWLKVAQGTAFFWVAAAHISSSNTGQTFSLSPRSSPARPHLTRSHSIRHRSRANFSEGTCPCSGSNVCVGPRGGRYCITSGGNKRYGI